MVNRFRRDRDLATSGIHFGYCIECVQLFKCFYFITYLPTTERRRLVEAGSVGKAAATVTKVNGWVDPTAMPTAVLSMDVDVPIWQGWSPGTCQLNWMDTKT